MIGHRPLGLWIVGLAIALIFGSAAGAQAQLDILSGKVLKRTADSPATGLNRPEDVVRVSAEFTPGAAGQPGTLSVTADIAPPWYTYALTQKPVQATPTTIKVDPSSDYQIVGDWRPNLPPVTKHVGDETFETHAPSVTWQAPLELKRGVDPANIEVTGRVRIQVCHDSCLPPTNFPFVAQVTARPAAEKTATAGVFQPERAHVAWRGHLEPQTAAPGSTVNLVLTALPAGNWHVYNLLDRDTNDLGYKPTLIVLKNTSGLKAGRAKTDDPISESPSAIPGGEPQRYHADRVTWTSSIKIPKDAKAGNYPIQGLIGYQVCSGASCDQPSGIRFDGVITVATAAGKQSAPLVFSEASYKDAAKAAAERPAEPAEALAPESIDSSLLAMIGLSLIGGFILNFMPCVLPVIGLKVLSFAEQAGRSRAHILTLNIWYSLGLLSVFMVLATLSSAVNLGLNDSNLHWGQQFSSTSFNVTMVAIVFVMALSFLGVWEIPIPGFVGSGKANDVAMREGALGAFAKGVITTILATPCSGPLLGAIFGYTLNQRPVITYAIFGAIGLGMASPYLLIGAFPRLIRALPKPGAWMETFKQMMGFVMLGTIVFFFSFMNRDYLVATFAMMIGLWAACWWIGRVSVVEPISRRLKAWAQGAGVATAVGVASFMWLTPHESLIPWRTNFSRAEIARLTADGQTVLVDFTADWCFNCKLNLRTAIETQEVFDLMKANNVVPVLADWTHGSQEIAESLESLKSSSIPVLAIFTPDKPPIILRDIITKRQVLEAIKRAGPSKTASASDKSLAASKP